MLWQQDTLVMPLYSLISDDSKNDTPRTEATPSLGSDPQNTHTSDFAVLRKLPFDLQVGTFNFANVGVKQLVQWAAYPKLREAIKQYLKTTETEINFSETYLTDAAFRGFFGPRGLFSEVKNLNLSEARFNLDLLPLLPRTLTQLNLSHQNLGLQKIGHIMHLHNLHALILDGNGIGDAGAIAIAESGHMSKLTDLNLYGNEIGDAGASAIAGSGHMSKLFILYLNRNGIGDVGVRAFRESQHLSKLVVFLHESSY